MAAAQAGTANTAGITRCAPPNGRSSRRVPIRCSGGDPNRWNPELELAAAASQCHMLSYLHLCVEAGVVVTAYSDDAYGIMAETEDGGGHFVEVVLRPQVTVAAPDMVDAAMTLHKDANAKWFIANSLNFPVRHEPAIVSGGNRS